MCLPGGYQYQNISFGYYGFNGEYVIDEGCKRYQGDIICVYTHSWNNEKIRYYNDYGNPTFTFDNILITVSSQNFEVLGFYVVSDKHNVLLQCSKDPQFPRLRKDVTSYCGNENDQGFTCCGTNDDTELLDYVKLNAGSCLDACNYDVSGAKEENCEYTEGCCLYGTRRHYDITFENPNECVFQSYQSYLDPICCPDNTILTCH